MGQCEESTFTIVLSNDTTQTLSSILITWERPSTDFVYSTGSSTITLHTGSSVPADPVETSVYLKWDIDAVLGYDYSLPPGAALTIGFLLGTNCSTVSGTHVVTAEGTGFATSPSDSLSVEILPGAVRIYKEPSVIDAHVGDTVTWTITVESTGLGPIHNVVVTDTLGAGISYVAATPAPDSVSGQSITWNLGTIPAGGQSQIELQAEVISCDGLDDKADARFGCDDGSICYDTAVDGGTATASIHLLVDNPLLEFTPPDIDIPYCNPAGTTVTMPITNSGDGPAKNVKICVDFPAELEVQDVQPPATWDGSCFHLPDLDAGGSYDLTFDLIYTGNWCTGGPSGTLYWHSIYDNVCGDEFHPPVKSGTYETTYGSDGPPTLAVDLTGDDQVYICTDHTYNLSASFSGLDSCGGGETSDVTVDVDVPAGFTVTDPGNGTWTPGGDGTGGTITWTTAPATPLATSFTLHAPGTDQCGQVATLTATATASDCCGCGLSVADSIDIAIECYQLITATRDASPTTQEKCGIITYTNTYMFADDAALDDISFDELTFTESAGNAQDYVEGSLSITIDGSAASPGTMVDNTPGGTFAIQGINDTGSVRGHTLVISYQLGFTAGSQPSSCPSSYSFYDWASLDLGPDCATGNQCTQPCQASEVLQITTATPSMDVSVTGLPSDFIDPCGTYDVTVTLTKTSDFDPYNAVLQLENLNYYIVDLSSIACSGDVTPTNCTNPTDNGTYYEWNYADAFVGQPSGTQSVLQFQVRKRCGSGMDLTATALFDDACGYSSCSVSASDAPSYVREPLLYIYKTPEVIYATENTVTWSIYVTNGGAGPAYEVWVDDVLGSGLAYDSSVVDPDVTVTAGQDHTGATINGASFHIPEISPGGTREIRLTARLVGCSDLTDQVEAGLSCGGDECLTPVTDTASVLIPNSVVVATSYTDSPMPACTDQYARITVKNGGDPHVYHLTASETLPTGLSYVSGSTEWQLDGGGWQAGGDPTISSGTLTWSESEVPGLSDLGSLSTLEIRFLIHADCSFTGGDLPVVVSYNTVCGATEQAPVGDFTLDASRPRLSVSKTQISPSGPIDCGGEATWEIRVTNTGDATADYVWIEDTLGGGFTYVSSQGDGTYAVDDGYNSGQVVTWALDDLPSGASATLRLTAQENGTCGDLSNSVQAFWGCGDDADGSSATDDSECLETTAATASTSGSRRPTVSPSVSIDPGSVPACGQATVTLTIHNTSTAAARDIDARITLPAGLSYIPGTTEIDCGTGFAPAADPTSSGSDLIWYDENDPSSDMCDEIPASGTISLRFRVQASCFTASASLPVTVYFSDCCQAGQYQASTNPAVSPALPHLSLTKERITPPPECGGEATWRITVTNDGSATADWTRIEDSLGGSLTYVDSSPAAAQIGADTWAWELGPLGPGDSTSVEITARLDQPTTCAPDLRTDTARATWGCGTPDGDPTTLDGCQSGAWADDSDLLPMPDLGVSQAEASLVCNPDGSKTLQVPIHNFGEIAASGVSIRVYVDGTLEYETVQDIPAGGSYPLSFTSAPLKCGESHTFRVAVDEDDSLCECDEVDNELSLSVTCPCPALVTDKEVVEILRGGVQVTPGLPVEPGDVVVYRLTVTNVGGATAYDVDLSDTLPAEFLYVSGSTSATWTGGSYLDDPTGAPGPDLSWDTSAELGPSESLTLEFHAVVTSAVVQGEVYTDTMCATGVEGEGTRIPTDMSATIPEDTDPDDCDSVSHVAAAVPALAVDKAIVDVLRGGVSIWPTDRVEPGDLIHYRFTVRNVGQGIAYQVGVTDQLSPGLEYDTDYSDGTYRVDSPADSGSLGIPDGATGTIQAGLSVQLNAGATLTADFYAYVTSAVQQGVPLENYATATGVDGYGVPIPEENVQIGDTSDDDPDDSDPDDTGSAIIDVVEPGLVLKKEIVDVLRGGTSIWPTEIVLPDDVIVYRVEVRNIGLGTAYNVDFTDDLPSGLEYDADYGAGTFQVSSPPQSGVLPFSDGAVGTLFAGLAAQIDPGATMTIEYWARVQPDARPGAILENHAEVTGDDGAGTGVPVYNPDVNDDQPDDDLTDIRIGIPALVTDKAIYLDPCRCDIPSMNPGTEFKFLLTVKNVGYSIAYDIVIDDLLPHGLSYVPKTSELHVGDTVKKLDPLIDREKRALTWITGLSLDPGGVLQLVFTVRIAPGLAVGTKICNTMQVSGVDYLGEPILADARDYVPEDIDPYDSASLRFTIGEPPPEASSRYVPGKGGA